MIKLGAQRPLFSCGIVLAGMLASSLLSAQTLPSLGGVVPSTSELLDVGLVFGGDMLSDSLLDDTLSLPGAGVVLGGTLLDSAESLLSLDLPVSLPASPNVLLRDDLPAL